MRLDKMWDCGQKIYGIKSVMKFKHYNSATSFVPWKKDYPTSQQFFPPYPKEKKKKRIVPYPPTIPLPPTTSKMHVTLKESMFLANILFGISPTLNMKLN